MSAPTTPTLREALSRKFRIGFVVGMCLVAIDAAIPLLLTDAVNDARLRAAAMETTADRLHALLSAYKDTETGQRGFMLTGSAQYLEPYRSGRAEIERLLPRIAQALAGHAMRQAQFAKLADLDRRESDYQFERIEARSVTPAETPAEAARGKALMDEIRVRVSALAADLDAERDSLHARAAALDTWSRNAIVAVTAIDLLLFAVLYVLMQRAGAARERTAAALVAANARLHDEIAARNTTLHHLEKQTARLNEVIATQSLLAQAQLDVGRFMQLVVHRMLALTPATGGTIELVQGDEMVYQTCVGSLAGFNGFRVRRAGSLAGLSIAEKQVMHCHDAAIDHRVDRAACAKVGIASMIVAPLVQEGVAIGVLKIASDQPYSFSEDDVQTVLLMAGMLGSALGNQLHFERIAALLGEREAALRSLEAELQRRTGAEAALLASRARTQAIIEGSQEALISVDKLCVVRDWNRQAELTFGWNRDEAVGRSIEDLIIPERFKDRLRRGIMHYVETGVSPAIGRRLELIARCRDGREVPIEVAISALQDGDDVEFPCFMHDISERKHAEAQLRAQEQTLRSIADNLPVLVSFIDARGVYRYCNGQYRAVIGRDPTGMTIREGIGNTDYASFEGYIDRALAGEPSTFETEIDTRDGRRVMEGHVLPQQDAGGASTGFYVVAWDIHARKQKELQWQSRASSDMLTGLMNRSYFMETLEQAVLRQKRSGEPMAVLYLDIDRFKDVNDNLGHAAGDYILKAYAQHLKASVREADVVCRFGGDEFCVLLENVGAEENAVAVAEKILQISARPQLFETQVLHITTSIGIAYAPFTGRPAEALLRMADGALYKAKQWGRDQYSLYAVPAGATDEETAGAPARV
jgi:diguanylate cyclase (GGDEF)-like protein/PAS domain S-box-containing protein